MTNFNQKMTIEEATELFNAKDGMNYFATPHNKEIMKQVIDTHLKSQGSGTNQN